MPTWVTLDKNKHCKILVDNCASYNLVLPRNNILGILDFQSEQCVPPDESTISAIIENIEQ
jgi:hypothetical protein